MKKKKKKKKEKKREGMAMRKTEKHPCMYHHQKRGHTLVCRIAVVDQSDPRLFPAEPKNVPRAKISVCPSLRVQPLQRVRIPRKKEGFKKASRRLQEGFKKASRRLQEGFKKGAESRETQMHVPP
jgi:hypothetical protein